MRNIAFLLIIYMLLFSFNTKAQESAPAEKYGNTLNVGLGIGGYSGYYDNNGLNSPVFNINYEIDAARNFTLAPFLSFYSYRRDYYYGNPQIGFADYYFHETIIPIGVKGYYYFDQLLKANPRWDFYLAASLGFAIVDSYWSSGYEGNTDVFSRPNPLFLDLHIGTEFHINSKIGIYLDLSTGVSTIGLAFHSLSH